MGNDALRGIGVFGRAYEQLYKDDLHAEGSVDRALLDGMVRLTAESATGLYRDSTAKRYDVGSRPALEKVLASLRLSPDPEKQVESIVRFCADLAGREDIPLLFGGTEEQIIGRGSDWCTDLARVACSLCQVAGMPARIIVLANLQEAYCGHEIIEAYRPGAWGAADPVAAVVYRHDNGRPATAWELVNDLTLVRRHYSNSEDAKWKMGEFAAAAVVDYPIHEADQFDFSVSGPNAYYLTILDMAEKGWPGGLRWLFGEDSLTEKRG